MPRAHPAERGASTAGGSFAHAPKTSTAKSHPSFFIPPSPPRLRRKIAGRSTELAADLLAQPVDQHQLALALDMPEGPAVAGRRALQLGRDGMDRAAMLGRNEAAIGAHPGAPAPPRVDQHLARLQQAALDEAAERDARRLAPRLQRNDLGLRR